MRNKLSTKVVIVLLVLLMVLLTAVATVSAADSSGSAEAIARVDVSGEEGLTVVPVSGIDYRPINPWGIDATRINLY